MPCVSGWSQDSLCYTKYENLLVKKQSYSIIDIYNKPYKFFDEKKNKEYAFINGKKQKLDTSIYIDATIKSYKNRISINDTLLMEYYHKNIFSPKHGGDPNNSVVSFIVDEKGNLITISIIENVKNACNNNWKIIYDKGVKFKSITPRKTLVEYVLKMDDICYCDCLVIDDEIIPIEYPCNKN